MRTIGVAGVALVLAGALAGCDAPHAPTPRLWTVADLKAINPVGEDGQGAIAMDAGLPGGVKLGKILDPTDSSKLVARATIADGYNGAYVTTEVWTHFDEVWLQPMYIPVTGWVNGVPQPVPNDTRTTNTWIFSVGPHSRFYSPFWQMVYFQVKADAPPVTSAREVLDGTHALQFGPGRTVSIVPGGVVAPAPLYPATAPLTTGTAWLEGQPTTFLDFGKATFTWNDDAVIDEVPIYIFLMRNSKGELFAPDIPTVAGTGPPGSGGPPPTVIAGQNRYVTYWRLYTVTLPATARIFDPYQALSTELTKQGVPFVTNYDGPGVLGYPEPVHWVALNPGGDNGAGGCFASGTLIDPHPTGPPEPDRCIWLDSQAAIENNIDRSAIERTDVTATCPFVSFALTDVSPIK